MKQRIWPLATKKRGERMVTVTFKVDPAFAEALRAFSRQESARMGYRVGQGRIVQELSLEADTRLRRTYKRLKPADAAAAGGKLSEAVQAISRLTPEQRAKVAELLSGTSGTSTTS